MNNWPISFVYDVKYILINKNKKNKNKNISLLKKIRDLFSKGSFYYSYQYDLTRSIESINYNYISSI